jgi:hypothetical protein
VRFGFLDASLGFPSTGFGGHHVAEDSR